ncbi:MAG: HAD-IIIC family phosphatase [Alphaproteobacteria bacterium]|nr:MAG: HAD-IIIC family phosphatase [Alphaproteobacteria bacterium]
MDGLAVRGDPVDAVASDIAQFRNRLSAELDFTSASSAVRQLKKLRKQGAVSATTTRIAVLGNTTMTQLSGFIELFMFAHNVDAVIYEAPYGVMRQEILDPTSQLYAFNPQFIFLAPTRRDLGALPSAQGSADQLNAAVDEAAAEWSMLWEIAHERLGCQIIQNNFDMPPWQVFGNLEMSQPGAPGHFIDQVNRALNDRAPPWVSIHDVDRLSSMVGRWNWGDERFYHIAKLPCAPDHLPIYGRSVASLVAARLGRSRKCLVLDLDNTMWGGVIGDDGLHGIKLGQGDAIGEAYVAFQRYIKGLAERGVILAVCSKNEDTNAREPFEKHPEMVLRLDDISCFVANWDDKAANLRRIAQDLNIGLDSLVFVDDNPAERSIVRRLVPEVAVPELPDDPADYLRALDIGRYFDTVSISAEDFKRTGYYKANAERRQTASSVGDIEQFLASLDMRASVGPIGPMELERSVQLIGKSNQFNLTTRRYSAADLQAMTSSAAWFTRYVKLTDKFGDNGLISVLLARKDNDALAIDTWLMSCRVLKRGVEQMLLNEVVEIARQSGLTRVTGEYLPTAKNVLVKDHYASLGFTLVSDTDGATSWELDVAAWTPIAHHIEVVS